MSQNANSTRDRILVLAGHNIFEEIFENATTRRGEGVLRGPLPLRGVVMEEIR